MDEIAVNKYSSQYEARLDPFAAFNKNVSNLRYRLWSVEPLTYFTIPPSGKTTKISWFKCSWQSYSKHGKKYKTNRARVYVSLSFSASALLLSLWIYITMQAKCWWCFFVGKIHSVQQNSSGCDLFLYHITSLSCFLGMIFLSFINCAITFIYDNDHFQFYIHMIGEFHSGIV